jgi:hypothetical protein
MSSTFVGSARITSDQPLAATATQWQLSGGNWRMFSAYEAIGQPASPTNTPLLMRANYGFDNSLSIQNASAVATNVSVDYYRRIQDGGSYCGTDSLASLGGYRVGRLFPAPSAGLCPPSLFVGSGHVTNSSSSPLALVVNQARQAQLSSYSIGGSPSSVAVLPLVMRSYSTFGTSSWSTGIHVQNVGTASTVVTAVYYYGAGSVAGTYSTSSLAPNSMENIFPVQTPDGFFGSAVLTSSNGQPILVEVNQIAGSDPAVDTFFSTTSVNR